MSNSESNSDAHPKKMVELLVMLKTGHGQENVAPLAEAVHAQIVEVRTMFGNKIVGLMTLEASASDEALTRLKQDGRVEIAQVNRTYKHC